MDFLLDRTLRPKIGARFGGRIKAMVSGGAPLNPEVGIFFHSLGLTFLQGYGQTEAAPVISCNRPRAGIKLDTVGPPLKNTEVRIAEDGEILVRGELVMKGYWRNPSLTERAIVGGWLHTGDVGHLDEKGRIKITDRKKDLIVLDKGDNVAPQRVEGMLTLQPEIAQAMVSGDRRPYLVGLIVPEAGMDGGLGEGERQAERFRRLARRSRIPARAQCGGRSGQWRAFGDREGPPLHPRRRAVHRRERAADPLDQDPPPRPPRRLWRAAGRAVSALSLPPPSGARPASASEGKSSAGLGRHQTLNALGLPGEMSDSAANAGTRR